jgi:hypothetical protein
MRQFLLCLGILVLIGPDRPPAISSPDRAFPTWNDDYKECGLPTTDEFVALAKTDPVAALKAGVARYRREVTGFHATLVKQERIKGKLNPLETIDIWYRDDPHSVYMEWKGESVGQADRVLYIDGANDNQLLARPKSALARKIVGSVIARDPEGSEARATSRVSVRDSGLCKAAEKVVVAWEKAKIEGTLHVEYQGIQVIPEAGDRQCYVFKRTMDQPDEEGLKYVVIGIDVETWRQVANILTDSEGNRIAAYWFKDVELNPAIPEGTFEKSALTK